jgi:predicted glycosyltransferase
LIQNEKNSNCKKKPLLLFSPLDWGLGHTTRSLPILREFLHCGFEIVVACNSIQKLILAAELPSLAFAPLEGYNVNYSHSGTGFRRKIATQLINILTKIKHENEWVRKFRASRPVDLILSDNRYGFHHPEVPSVIITHQLAPKTGLGRHSDALVQRFLYRHINKFTECWIPDVQQAPNLSGELSHTPKLPRTSVKYIGQLTRFHENIPVATEDNLLLIVLSGPEPQRTIFENILLKQLPAAEYKTIIVRGLPAEEQQPNPINDVAFYNHLDAEQLNDLAWKAQYVLCRPGYTSLMDMLSLKKKMIVVSTPGQTEQEYLARHLSKNKITVSFEQKNFDLRNALATAAHYSFHNFQTNTTAYKDAIGEIVSRVCTTSTVSS